jgi:hypothetical protein
VDAAAKSPRRRVGGEVNEAAAFLAAAGGFFLGAARALHSGARRAARPSVERGEPGHDVLPAR